MRNILIAPLLISMSALRTRRRSACFLSLSVAITALAQHTVGEVLDAGGAQLNKDALTSVISGKSLQTSPPPFQGKIAIASDGTYWGFVQRTDHTTAGMFGTWTIHDDGAFCLIQKQRNQPTICRYWFDLGGRYFASATLERKAQVWPRTIE